MTYSLAVRDLRLPPPYLRGMYLVLGCDRIVPQGPILKRCNSVGGGGGGGGGGGTGGSQSPASGTPFSRLPRA